MAVYKVPQDVEAEDKLVGPFSFRQFIYLIIAALGIATGVVLFRAFPALAIIPLPIVLAMLALALPLRKDQPMETYLLALIRFYLKPKIRIWNPDGTITYVEVFAPKAKEEVHAKDMTGTEAIDRLDYLARVMDSRGWAVKGVDSVGTSLAEEVKAEAATTSDVMDDHADLARSFDTLLAQKNEQTRQAAVERMQTIAKAPPPQPLGSTPALAFPTKPVDDPSVHFNPYPTSMHQQVIKPISDEPDDSQTASYDEPGDATTPPAKTEPKQSMTATVSPDIMRLANSKDLSISAIAHEAQRLSDQEGQEVVISLR